MICVYFIIVTSSLGNPPISPNELVNPRVENGPH